MTHPTPPQAAGSSPYSPDQLLKPQGLKPHPHVSAHDYPCLGFNPTPGSCEAVHDLKKKLHHCAGALHDAHKVVTHLLDGSYWEGDAAVAFREQVEGGPLPLNLKNAAHSLDKAVKQLGRWHDELDDFQGRAKSLEHQAKTAHAALTTAQHKADRAADDPDLHTHGHRHDAAHAHLKKANGHLDQAQTDLDDIINRAKKLAQEHENKAGERARKIQDATEKLAPHEPGTFESIGSWISDNLPDILSTVAGIVAIVGLFIVTGGTAAVVLLVLAAAASGGALSMRLADPATRSSLMDGFTKGEFDADFWGNAVAVGGDILGLAPGVGATGKGGIAALRAVGEGGEALSLSQKLALWGPKTTEAGEEILSLENPLLTYIVKSAKRTDDAEAVESSIAIVEKTSGALGGATALYGLGSKAIDALDSDSAGNAATGIDGIRLGVDSGTLSSLIHHLL